MSAAKQSAQRPRPSWSGSSAFWTRLAAVLGLAGFAVVLAWHNTADNDLWARLAVGARAWHTATLWTRDVFAFTPTLPEWVDHEWGAGLIFFTVLKAGGSAGLMILKIGLALAALGLALDTGRRRGAPAAVLLLIALPCAWALLPGYVPVIRSHALTYAAFALMLWLAERVATDRWIWWPLMPALFLVWANVHGGFVAGFAIPAAYALAEGARFLLQGRARGTLRQPAAVWPWLVLITGVAATCINPWGWRFYTYLVPALLHPRPRIGEWAPLTPWGWDAFTGFRLLTVLALIMVAALGWRLRPDRRYRLAPALLILVLTAAAGWLHRRHAPFFGLAAAALLPALLANLHPGRRTGPALAGLYALVAAGLLWRFLPAASLQVYAPVGLFPVRECDILARAGFTGNAAVPFDWGSYTAWRLYPGVRVSIDGRYEETYPETTFEANACFFNREGPAWDRLVREHRVDVVLLDLRRTRLTPTDLAALGFEPVYATALSALWARPEQVKPLRAAVATLPDTTVDPLDPTIPARWF